MKKVGGCLGIWEKGFAPKWCKSLLIDRKRTCRGLSINNPKHTLGKG